MEGCLPFQVSFAGPVPLPFREIAPLLHEDIAAHVTVHDEAGIVAGQHGVHRHRLGGASQRAMLAERQDFFLCFLGRALAHHDATEIFIGENLRWGLVGGWVRWGVVNESAHTFGQESPLRLARCE